MKPYFTKLILDLSHILSFELFENYPVNLSIGSFIRLKRGNTIQVSTLKDGIIFFRDALVHPEHSETSPSPRNLPQHPQSYNNYEFFTEEENDDYAFIIAEGKIYLKKDIQICLKNLEKINKTILNTG
jgi:hypothetical protein